MALISKSQMERLKSDRISTLKIPNHFDTILSFDIEPRICTDERGVYIDFDTQAKSQMYLRYYEEHDEWVIEGRYDYVEIADKFDDLVERFKDCYWMRDFGHPGWIDLWEWWETVQFQEPYINWKLSQQKEIQMKSG